MALFISVWGWLNALTGLHIGAIPQRRPACRGDVWWLGLHPDVVQYLPDVSAVGDERDDVHLPATDWAQQRKHLIDTGNQHRPQVVDLPPPDVLQQEIIEHLEAALAAFRDVAAGLPASSAALPGA